MAEYIERKEFVSAIDELMQSPYANDETPFSSGVKNCLKLVLDMAIGSVPDNFKIPDADVRENVRGKWIDDGFLDRKTCSICGKWIANNTGTAELNYCPNCGEDMRGAE